MHIETLKIFCDVVENQSFSLAASQNFITQSAVSQQIRGLEERYGKRLLERRRGSVKPTAAGDVLHRSSRAILHAFNEMEAQLQGLSNIVSGSVRVGTVHSVGLYELSEPLKAYFTDFPARERLPRVRPIELGLRSGASWQRRFRHRRVSDRARADHGERVPQRPTPHRLRTRSSADRARQGACRWSRRREIHRVRERHPDAHGPRSSCSARRISGSSTSPELDNIEMIKRLVEVGAGIALLPEKSFAFEVQSGTLVKIELADKDLRRPIGIIYPHRQALQSGRREVDQLSLRHRPTDQATHAARWREAEGYGRLSCGRTRLANKLQRIGRAEVAEEYREVADAALRSLRRVDRPPPSGVPHTAIVLDVDEATDHRARLLRASRGATRRLLRRSRQPARSRRSRTDLVRSPCSARPGPRDALRVAPRRASDSSTAARIARRASSAPSVPRRRS